MQNTIPENLRGCNTINGIDISLANNIGDLPMEIIDMLPKYKGALKNRGFNNGKYIHLVLNTNRKLLGTIYSLLHCNIICQQISKILLKYNLVIIDTTEYTELDDSLRTFLAELLRFRGYRIFNFDNNNILVVNAIDYKTYEDIEHIVDSFKRVDITCTIKMQNNFDENYYALIKYIIKSVPRLNLIDKAYKNALNELDYWDNVTYKDKNKLLYKLCLIYISCVSPKCININNYMEMSSENINTLHSLTNNQDLHKIIADILTLYEYQYEIENIDELEIILKYNLQLLLELLHPLFDDYNNLIQICSINDSEINSITYNSLKTSYKATDDIFFNIDNLANLESTIDREAVSKQQTNNTNRYKLLIALIILILLSIIAKYSL